METTTHISHLGRVCVPVGDQDRAIEFYCGTLGFEKRADIPYGNGERWVEVAPVGATSSIALVPPTQGNSAGIQTGICLSTTDIDAVHAHLQARGADVDAEVSRMGDPVPPLVWFRDPDGNSLFIAEEAG